METPSPRQRRNTAVGNLSKRVAAFFSSLGSGDDLSSPAQEDPAQFTRLRADSAQRVTRRLSQKITTPSLSHAAHLLPSSTTSSHLNTPSHRPSVIHPNDFYNADFSNANPKPAPNLTTSPHNPNIQTLNPPTSNRLSASNKNGTLDLETTKHGLVFIEALNSLAVFGAAREEGGEGEEGRDSKANKRTSRSSLTSINIALPIPSTTPPTHLKPTSKATPSSAPQISNVDLSDLFPSDFLAHNKQEGVVVFRIENMRPEIVEPEEHGHFCIADCYVIISTTTDSPHLQHYNNLDIAEDPTEPLSTTHLIHTIHTWIGPLSEMDKRFCCAMFAVGVKNLLGVGESVVRHTQGEETEAFVELFEGEVGYDDPSFAAESGLFVAERRRWGAVKVYRVAGVGKGGRVRMEVVRPVKRSLETGNVFLVDAGYAMVQWNGAGSCLTVRAKCRILVDVMKGVERAGKAEVVEIDEGEVCEKLDELLPEIDEADATDADAREASQPPATLYKVPSTEDTKVQDTPIDVANLVVATEENNTGFHRTLLSPHHCYILDTHTSIYLWIGAKSLPTEKLSASETLARVILAHPQRPSFLNLERITQFNEPEPFKLYFADWIEPRTETLRIAARRNVRLTPVKVDVGALYAPHPLLESPTRVVVGMNRFLQGLKMMEEVNSRVVEFRAFAFEKGRFVGLEGVERGGVHLCGEGRYAFLAVYSTGAGEVGRGGEGDVTEAMNRALKVMSAAGADEAFRVGGNAYPVVKSCGSLSRDDGAARGSKGRRGGKDVVETACVIYFWVGKQCSGVAEKTFRFHARQELQDAVQEIYGSSVQIVQVVQEREPLELLAHWGNRSVIHRGSRKDLLARLSAGGEGESVLYHIRTDWKFKTTRAIQVPCACERLISRDCFFVHKVRSDPGVGFLWTGKNSTSEDARRAVAIADRISSFHLTQMGSDGPVAASATSDTSLHSPTHGAAVSDDSTALKEVALDSKSTAPPPRYRIITEPLEPRAFFSLFPNGKQPYATGPMPPILVKPSPLDPPTATSVIPTNLPRLLVCSCAKGYFCVEEVPFFDQSSLDRDTCAILDPGPHSPVYLWIGASASFVVEKLARKAVEVWLETLEDGRRKWEGEMASGEGVVDGVVVVWEGGEGAEFQGLFHGWRSGLDS
ncbi:hypothetical protein HDU98_002103 [Podochytrium sp. JEL0797]|nr:hypothetical protein HDU98_002103 [Podochytrium sp. JEL0797]